MNDNRTCRAAAVAVVVLGPLPLSATRQTGRRKDDDNNQVNDPANGENGRQSVRLLTWLLLLLLAAVGLLAGTVRQESPEVWQHYSEAPPQAMPQAPAPVAATGPLAEVYRDARDATVRIESRCGDALFGDVPLDVGSGFFVSAGGQLLTAYHVIRRQALAAPSRCRLEYLAVDASGAKHSLTLTGFDARLDLALMQADVPRPVSYLPLARNLPEIGSGVVAIGNSRGEFLADRAGVVTRRGVRAGLPDFAPGTVELTAALAPGDSGGPVLGADGRVVGVVSYISFDPAVLTSDAEGTLAGLFRAYQAPDFASYAVPLTEGSTTIAALRRGESRDVPVVGFEVAFDYHPGNPALPSLGPRPGVVVGRVEPKGPGASAGLRSLQERTLLDSAGRQIGARLRADVIVAVDGTPTPTMERLLETVREKEVGEEARLVVQRDQRTVELNVRLAGYREIFE